MEEKQEVLLSDTDSTLTGQVIGFFRSKMIRNSGIYIGGNFLQKFSVFLLLPVYTYFLSPSEFGITGLATTIEGVLAILFGFGIKSSIARYYFDYDDDKVSLKKFISSNFQFLLFLSLFLTILLQQFGGLIWGKITSGQIPFNPYIVMVLWSSFASIIINFITTLYQTQQNAKAFVLAQLSTVILTITFTILFIGVYRFGAIGLLFARMISNLIMAGILTIILIRQWFVFHFSYTDVKNALVFGIPLVFHGIFSWAVSSIDRIMLEPNIPLSELGLYNLGYQIGTVLTAFLVSINQAWVPYYYSLMKKFDNKTDEKISSIFNLYFVLIGIVCLTGMLFSKEILHIFSSSQYYGASIFVPLILYSALLNGYYFMFSTPIFYQKKTIWIPILTGIAAILNIGLNMLLIPGLGALGSAWATLISYFALAIFTLVIGRRLQPIKLPLLRIGMLNLILLSGVVMTTYPIFDNQWLNGLKLVLILLFIIFVYFGFVRDHLFVLNT